MAKYHQVVTIPKELAETIDKYLNASGKDKYQGKDNSIRCTAVFPDGMEMNIVCCGVQDGPSWAEAILFTRSGMDLCWTQPSEEFLGDWELEFRGTTYSVTVAVEDDNT